MEKTRYEILNKATGNSFGSFTKSEAEKQAAKLNATKPGQFIARPKKM